MKIPTFGSKFWMKFCSLCTWSRISSHLELWSRDKLDETISCLVLSSGGKKLYRNFSSFDEETLETRVFFELESGRAFEDRARVGSSFQVRASGRVGSNNKMRARVGSAVSSPGFSSTSRVRVCGCRQREKNEERLQLEVPLSD